MEGLPVAGSFVAEKGEKGGTRGFGLSGVAFEVKSLTGEG
jgi:hypothetical protein